MSRRVLLALALIAFGLTIGLLASRLFDSVGTGGLALFLAFLAGLAVGALLMVATLPRQGQGASLPLKPPELDTAPPFPLTPSEGNGGVPVTAAEPAPVAPASRFRVTRQQNRYSAQARDIGRYESVKFSVVLPREWWQPTQTGGGEQIATGAVIRSFARAETFAWVMFAFSLLAYAFTRLYKIDEFPISFLGDEAVVVTLARDLVRNGFHDPKLGWFPLYFDFFFVVNPLISVYLQAIATQLFGTSIAVTRTASALLTLVSAGAVALTLKSFFGLRYWWTAVLFLAITPAWFFHSRTVFDTVTATAFYGIFLFCYCLYRYRSPRLSFLVIVAAAAVFYSYPAAQLVLALTSILLALSDLDYHLKNVKWWVLALPVIALTLIPYFRFVQEHPEESWYHLRSLDSYVVQDIPLSEKITGFFTRYAAGISPLYWFVPNDIDLVRHRMKDYGHLPLLALPLILVGIGVCISRLRDSRYRLLLIALVSTPFAAALVDVLILRLLSFVIPAALLAVLGLEFLLNRFAARLSHRLISVLLLVLLSFGGIWMTRDALVNGPTWFEAYDLYGMQWGAKQLFQVLGELRDAAPKSPIVMTSSWANGTEEFIEFFMPEDRMIRTRTIDAWIENQEPLSRNILFVMTPNELARARASGKFAEPERVWRLDYPNGARAFEIVRMAYADNIDELFEQERRERAKPVTEAVAVREGTVTLTHSQFDSGRAQDMFDGDNYTLARGRDANPLLLELEYPTPLPISGLDASFGQMRFAIKVSLFAPGSTQPAVYEETWGGDAPIPEIHMTFENPPPQVKRIRVEILHLDSPGEAKIHVRELQFR
jgi:4-amino-4-deoxy-L-arabinose transferase-like glycosyltransferase